MDKKKTFKRFFKNSSPGIGFRYSVDDEIAIEKACRIAKKFMTTKYGKGAQPHRLGVGDI